MPYAISTTPSASGGPLKAAVPMTVSVSRSTTANPCLHESVDVAARRASSHACDTSPETKKSRTPSARRMPPGASSSLAPSMSAMRSSGEKGWRRMREVITMRIGSSTSQLRNSERQAGRSPGRLICTRTNPRGERFIGSEDTQRAAERRFPEKSKKSFSVVLYASACPVCFCVKNRGPEVPQPRSSAVPTFHYLTRLARFSIHP